MKKGTEEPEEQEDNKWEALFGSNLSSFLVDDLQDLGKSSALTKRKARVLSKGKKGRQPLALEDLPPLEEGEEQPPAEETLEEVLKARDTLQGWLNSFEEVEELVNSSKVLGKATLRKADCLKKQVCEHLGFYKTLLLKKRECSEKELKAKLLTTASLVQCLAEGLCLSALPKAFAPQVPVLPASQLQDSKQECCKKRPCFCTAALFLFCSDAIGHTVYIVLV